MFLPPPLSLFVTPFPIGAAEAIGLGFVCFVVINQKFSSFTPPPPLDSRRLQRRTVQMSKAARSLLLPQRRLPWLCRWGVNYHCVSAFSSFYQPTAWAFFFYCMFHLSLQKLSGVVKTAGEATGFLDIDAAVQRINNNMSDVDGQLITASMKMLAKNPEIDPRAAQVGFYHVFLKNVLPCYHIFSFWCYFFALYPPPPPPRDGGWCGAAEATGLDYFIFVLLSSSSVCLHPTELIFGVIFLHYTPPPP